MDPEEACYRRDIIEDGEYPLSRFGVHGRGNDRKDKGDRNTGDRDRYGDCEPLGTPTDELSLRVDDVHDTLAGMPTCRLKLVRYMSSRKIHMLSGSISDHLISQGSQGVGSGAATLFGAWKRSRMNIIGSRIIRLSNSCYGVDI